MEILYYYIEFVQKKYINYFRVLTQKANTAPTS